MMGLKFQNDKTVSTKNPEIIDKGPHRKKFRKRAKVNRMLKGENTTALSSFQAAKVNGALGISELSNGFEKTRNIIPPSKTNEKLFITKYINPYRSAEANSFPLPTPKQLQDRPLMLDSPLYTSNKKALKTGDNNKNLTSSPLSIKFIRNILLVKPPSPLQSIVKSEEFSPCLHKLPDHKSLSKVLLSFDSSVDSKTGCIFSSPSINSSPLASQGNYYSSSTNKNTSYSFSPLAFNFDNSPLILSKSPLGPIQFDEGIAQDFRAQLSPRRGEDCEEPFLLPTNRINISPNTSHSNLYAKTNSPSSFLEKSSLYAGPLNNTSVLSTSSTTQNFWTTLEPNFNFIMGQDLIHQCQEAECFLANHLNNPNFASSYNDFLELYNKIIDMLNQFAENLQNGCLQSSNDIVSAWESKHNNLTEKAAMLIQRYPDLDTEIKVKVDQVAHKWGIMEKILAQRESYHKIPNLKDLKDEIEEMTAWLDEVEENLRHMTQSLNSEGGRKIRNLSELQRYYQIIISQNNRITSLIFRCLKYNEFILNEYTNSDTTKSSRHSDDHTTTHESSYHLVSGDEVVSQPLGTQKLNPRLDEQIHGKDVFNLSSIDSDNAVLHGAKYLENRWNKLRLYFFEVILLLQSSIKVDSREHSPNLTNPQESLSHILSYAKSSSPNSSCSDDEFPLYQNCKVSALNFTLPRNTLFFGTNCLSKSTPNLIKKISKILYLPPGSNPYTSDISPKLLKFFKERSLSLPNILPALPLNNFDKTEDIEEGDIIPFFADEYEKIIGDMDTPNPPDTITTAYKKDVPPSPSIKEYRIRAKVTSPTRYKTELEISDQNQKFPPSHSYIYPYEEPEDHQSTDDSSCIVTTTSTTTVTKNRVVSKLTTHTVPYERYGFWRPVDRWAGPALTNRAINDAYPFHDCFEHVKDNGVTEYDFYKRNRETFYTYGNDDDGNDSINPFVFPYQEKASSNQINRRKRWVIDDTPPAFKTNATRAYEYDVDVMANQKDIKGLEPNLACKYKVPRPRYRNGYYNSYTMDIKPLHNQFSQNVLRSAPKQVAVSSSRFPYSHRTTATAASNPVLGDGPLRDGRFYKMSQLENTNIVEEKIIEETAVKSRIPITTLKKHTKLNIQNKEKCAAPLTGERRIFRNLPIQRAAEVHNDTTCSDASDENSENCVRRIQKIAPFKYPLPRSHIQKSHNSPVTTVHDVNLFPDLKRSRHLSLSDDCLYTSLTQKISTSTFDQVHPFPAIPNHILYNPLWSQQNNGAVESHPHDAPLLPIRSNTTDINLDEYRKRAAERNVVNPVNYNQPQKLANTGSVNTFFSIFNTSVSNKKSAHNAAPKSMDSVNSTGARSSNLNDKWYDLTLLTTINKHTPFSGIKHISNSGKSQSMFQGTKQLNQGFVPLESHVKTSSSTVVDSHDYHLSLDSTLPSYTKYLLPDQKIASNKALKESLDNSKKNAGSPGTRTERKSISSFFSKISTPSFITSTKLTASRGGKKSGALNHIAITTDDETGSTDLRKFKNFLPSAEHDPHIKNLATDRSGTDSTSESMWDPYQAPLYSPTDEEAEQLCFDSLFLPTTGNEKGDHKRQTFILDPIALDSSHHDSADIQELFSKLQTDDEATERNAANGFSSFVEKSKDENDSKPVFCYGIEYPANDNGRISLDTPRDSITTRFIQNFCQKIKNKSKRSSSNADSACVVVFDSDSDIEDLKSLLVISKKDLRRALDAYQKLSTSNSQTDPLLIRQLGGTRQSLGSTAISEAPGVANVMRAIGGKNDSKELASLGQRIYDLSTLVNICRTHIYFLKTVIENIYPEVLDDDDDNSLNEAVGNSVSSFENLLDIQEDTKPPTHPSSKLSPMKIKSHGMNEGIKRLNLQDKNKTFLLHDKWQQLNYKLNNTMKPELNLLNLFPNLGHPNIAADSHQAHSNMINNWLLSTASSPQIRYTTSLNVLRPRSANVKEENFCHPSSHLNIGNDSSLEEMTGLFHSNNELIDSLSKRIMGLQYQHRHSPMIVKSPDLKAIKTPHYSKSRGLGPWNLLYPQTSLRSLHSFLNYLFTKQERRHFWKYFTVILCLFALIFAYFWMFSPTCCDDKNNFKSSFHFMLNWPYGAPPK